jgi:hypothetical protein
LNSLQVDLKISLLLPSHGTTDLLQDRLNEEAMCASGAANRFINHFIKPEAVYIRMNYSITDVHGNIYYTENMSIFYIEYQLVRKPG